MYLMKSSILFALLSLVFAGVNDVVFKKYSSKKRSRGMYIFGIGIIWTFLQAVPINIISKNGGFQSGLNRIMMLFYLILGESQKFYGKIYS
jgi:hypothetical protein